MPTDAFRAAKVDGGIPRRAAPGSFLDALARGSGSVMRTVGLPAQMRLLAQAILGQKAFTNPDFTPDELEGLQAAAETARRRHEAERARGQRVNRGIQYKDYPEGLSGLSSGLQAFNAEQALPLSIGRANLDVDPLTGQGTVTDTYDFTNDARKADVARYQEALREGGRLGQLRELLDQSKDYSLKKLLTTGLAGELGEMLLPEGPSVRVALPRPLATSRQVRRAILAN